MKIRISVTLAICNTSIRTIQKRKNTIQPDPQEDPQPDPQADSQPDPQLDPQPNPQPDPQLDPQPVPESDPQKDILLNPSDNMAVNSQGVQNDQGADNALTPTQPQMAYTNQL